MPNIGDRLEEARKRQGISIREAAEATKVRGDFLLNFENNQFDFDLPEVYKRGFLKLYARYLKLDIDTVMTDYNAVMLGSSKLGKRESRENFGRMDLAESTKPLGSPDSQPPFGAHSNQHGTPSPKQQPASTPSMSGAPADPMDTRADVTLYWKIGLIFVGGFIIVGLIAMLVNAIVSSSSVDSVVIEDGTGAAQVEAVSNRGPIKIIASGDVLNLMVRQDLGNERLFRGPMRPGEEIVIEREGPVRIVSSDIDKITVELNGKRFNSPAQGMGQMHFSMTGPE